MTERTYDIVVYGATGFTGRLVADYLAQKDESFTWAIAGRNQAKLAAVKAELVAANAACEDVGVIVANSAEPATLTAMTASARVLITTVGPYLLYGEPLVKACVETATDYVDLTGEPEFVDNLLANYHDVSAEKQIRIINCCGFDSIPHDYGVYYTMLQYPDAQKVRLEGFFSGSGTFSGGTWASALEAMSRRPGGAKAPKKALAEGRKVKGLRSRVRYVKDIKGYGVPMPTIDPLVVLRSARELPLYGADFRYGHNMRIDSRIKLAMGAVGLGAVVGLAQLKPTRNLLQKLRPSGAGPDAEKRAKSYFRVAFIGEIDGKAVSTEVSGGDPGYGETSKMISEAALALVQDREALPEVYGVLTPVVALRDPLFERLKKEGIKFETKA